jgi:hypothetical protein
LFLISINASESVIGQQAKSKAEVRAMFPPGTRDLWINYLSGSLDNNHVVDMIIGTDGHTCKGIYTMRNSNVTFYFDGEEVNKQMKLIEVNNNAKTTGFLYGNYDGESFVGKWMNYDKNINLSFKLKYVNNFDEFRPAKCMLNQWYNIYNGKVEGKEVQLSIIKDQDIYTCMVLQDGKRQKDIVPVIGERYSNIDLKFKNTVLSNNYAVVDTLNFDKINIVKLDESGYEVVTQLERVIGLQYECYEYADEYSRLKCDRPVSGNKKFDTWMENVFKSWTNANVKKMKGINPDDMGTRERWVHVANGWVELDLVLNDIISGTIYMESSLNVETEKIAFIYDFKHGKEMLLQDIFDQNFDSKGYFKVVIPTKKKLVNWKPELKKWIDKQSFNHVTLKENGISFKTDYNTIYGEKEILVAYKEVGENIKNKSILKDLMGR